MRVEFAQTDFSASAGWGSPWCVPGHHIIAPRQSVTKSPKAPLKRLKRTCPAHVRDSDAGQAALEWLLTPDEDEEQDELPSACVYAGYLVYADELGIAKPLSRRSFSLLACQLKSKQGVPLVERFKGHDKCSWWRMSGAQAIRAGVAKESDWWSEGNVNSPQENESVYQDFKVAA